MGKKFLELLGLLGATSPLIGQSLAVAIDLVTVAAIVVVFIALFNQKANTRLIRLITAITFPQERKAKPRRARNR